ncbi:hypothetical protein HPB49_025130 [Dermacentor silvarum]|uniref:Uncharacterized protein n=1 Tax=Dermacentor silvarum TaxID=543639 RepID=A0ACB8E4G0_DERSI|nr:hypothetical protein HPB49_025130 [Dermacentor silvarum]
MQHTNPFVYIVQIVATLLLIPVHYYAPDQQALIYAMQPMTGLASDTSTAQMRIDTKENWNMPPTSSTISAVDGRYVESPAALQESILWSLKSGRNFPRIIGHGSSADMQHTNPFVYIVQAGSLNIYAVALPRKSLQWDLQTSGVVLTRQRRHQDRNAANRTRTCFRPGRLTMAVRVGLLSDRDSETTSVVLVVITPAPGVRPTTATSRNPTTEECAMAPTFAMLGSEECPGVVSLMPSKLDQCVDKLRSEGQKCDVAVTYQEVYNKVVRDLLCLDLAKGIAILNLTIHKVKEAGTILELLFKGNKNRSQHATDANAHSSWSRAIFQSYATVTENATNTSKQIRVSMCFVNIAGWQRADAAGRDINDQMREGTKLNLAVARGPRQLHRRPLGERDPASAVPRLPAHPHPEGLAGCLGQRPCDWDSDGGESQARGNVEHLWSMR